MSLAIFLLIFLGFISMEDALTLILIEFSRANGKAADEG